MFALFTVATAVGKSDSAVAVVLYNVVDSDPLAMPIEMTNVGALG